MYQFSSVFSAFYVCSFYILICFYPQALIILHIHIAYYYITCQVKQSEPSYSSLNICYLFTSFTCPFHLAKRLKHFNGELARSRSHARHLFLLLSLSLSLPLCLLCFFSAASTLKAARHSIGILLSPSSSSSASGRAPCQPLPHFPALPWHPLSCCSRYLRINISLCCLAMPFLQD